MDFVSQVTPLGRVAFPQFTGERVYMREFRQSDGLPADLGRWQHTVDSMLADIHTDDPIYIMIDQSHVEANQPQRRPGLHVDGYWVPGISAHGGGGGHRGSGHGYFPPPRHRAWGNHMSGDGGWQTATFEQPEDIILASSVSASRAMVGNFTGPVGDGGDCSHIDTSNLYEVVLNAHRAYIGNVTMLHESLPVPVAVDRTLVRLNLSNYTRH